MFAVVVTLKVKAEEIGAFLPLMRANAASALKDEPGCHQFDVATDPARPGDVFLYELYSDAKAFEDHLKTTHFQTFDRDTAHMITDKQVTTYSEVMQ